MACGLPVISTNSSVNEIMPDDLRPDLITDGASDEAQARTIHALLIRPDAELAEIGGRMRRLAVDEHSVDRLFERILRDTRELLSARSVKQAVRNGLVRAGGVLAALTRLSVRESAPSRCMTFRNPDRFADFLDWIRPSTRCWRWMTGFTSPSSPTTGRS